MTKAEIFPPKQIKVFLSSAGEGGEGKRAEMAPVHFPMPVTLSPPSPTVLKTLSLVVCSTSYKSYLWRALTLGSVLDVEVQSMLNQHLPSRGCRWMRWKAWMEITVFTWMPKWNPRPETIVFQSDPRGNQIASAFMYSVGLRGNNRSRKEWKSLIVRRSNLAHLGLHWLVLRIKGNFSASVTSHSSRLL